MKSLKGNLAKALGNRIQLEALAWIIISIDVSWPKRDKKPSAISSHYAWSKVDSCLSTMLKNLTNYETVEGIMDRVLMSWVSSDVWSAWGNIKRSHKRGTKRRYYYLVKQDWKLAMGYLERAGDKMVASRAKGFV